MNRLVVTVQAAIGIALLFGGGWLAVERLVAPAAALESEDVAQARARAAAADLAVAWTDMRDRQRIAARALASTSVLQELGRSFRSGGDRDRAMSRALQSARAQVGGVGFAAVIDKQRRLVAGDSSAAPLAKIPATLRALEGATSTRLETVGGDVMLVTATPLGDNNVSAALVLATPFDKNRMHLLTMGVPDGVAVILVSGARAVAGTLRPDRMSLLVPTDLVPITTLGADRYAVSKRSLTDDSATAILAVGLAEIRPGASASSIGQMRLLVIVLGALALLILFITSALAPRSATEPATAAEAPLAAKPEVIPPAPPTPLVPAQPHVQPDPQPIMGTAAVAPPASAAPGPLDFPAAPPFAESPHPTPVPPPSMEAQFAQKTVPSHRPETPPPAVIPLPPVTQTAHQEGRFGPPPSLAPRPSPTLPPSPSSSPPSARPAPRTPPPPSAPPSSPMSAFDAIAQAALSSAPPPSSAISLIGGPADLPAPKGGISPEVAAAQRAEAQRAAHRAPPPEAPPSYAPTPYDPELLEPKGEAIPLPGSAGGAASPPSYASGSAIPLPPSSAPTQPSSPPPSSIGPSGDPWQNPGAPSMKAVGPSGTVRGTSANSLGVNRSPSLSPNPSSLSSIAAAETLPAGIPPVVPGGPMEPFDESHYRLVYNEFVSSKARLGEAVDKITYEGFRTKLRTSEQALLDRHGCRAVRFQVLVRDRTVSLRPQLVR